jgi:hypothetical protein
MLFFRSEERVAEWCRANRVPQRPLVALSQLWRLSQAWYANRLTPEARRPAPAEMAGIFRGIGLEGSFWDPNADDFS